MNRLSVKQYATLFKDTACNWNKDRAPRMGAALAYYITLSLAPTVVIVLAIAGLAAGAEAARGRLIGQIQGLVGQEGAKAIEAMIQGTRTPAKGMLATVLGLATLFFGGTSAVTELRDALNTIWQVPGDTKSSHARSLFNVLVQRLYSFALVLAAGVVLLASVAVHTWISFAAKYTRPLVPMPPPLIRAMEGSMSFVLIALLFAFLFKVLPAVRLQWGDVSAGAVLTSLLFTLGKFFLGVYLIHAGFAENYGAAGSLVGVFGWVFFFAQGGFLGAEFTPGLALGFGGLPPWSNP